MGFRAGKPSKYGHLVVVGGVCVKNYIMGYFTPFPKEIKMVEGTDMMLGKLGT